MTPAQLALLGGMLLAGGAWLGVAALRPAPPRLAAVLAQLNAASPDPVGDPAGERAAAAAGWRRWLPAGVMVYADRNLGAADEDLAILGMTGADLAARKVGWAVCGLLVPAGLTASAAVAGAGVPVALPAFAGTALGVLGWVVPSRQVAARAAVARAEFTAALAAFLALVALERHARGSPAEALEEASRDMGSWPLQLIHAELVRAELSGQLPWDRLRVLGRRIGSEQLRTLADVVSAAADGAAVFETLLAEARNLRNAELAEQKSRAGVAGERLTLPGVVLMAGFFVLLMYPTSTRF